MRLDVYLVEKCLSKSRERAKEAVKKGYVKVNDRTIQKPSYEVSETDVIILQGEQLKYVGRGGIKLEYAINVFNIDLSDKVCLDIGASTGGFTDCMLRYGGKLVYAIDVGHDQLDASLINNIKVVNMERTNVKDLRLTDFEIAPDFIVADVSFISLSHILPKIKEFLPIGCSSVILIKPQFEAGKEFVGKNGIVKDRKVHVSVLNNIIDFCSKIGLKVCRLEYSPICGGDGNIEYLAYIANDTDLATVTHLDINNLTTRAFLELKQRITEK